MSQYRLFKVLAFLVYYFWEPNCYIWKLYDKRPYDSTFMMLMINEDIVLLKTKLVESEHKICI